MNSDRFEQWLAATPIKKITREGRVRAVLRVESAYDIDLDLAYDRDGLSAVLDTLQYSQSDKDVERPNPSRINIYVGDMRSQLAWYRSHLNSYLKFRATLKNGAAQL